MATGSTLDVLSKLDPTLTQNSQAAAKKKNGDIGKEQFLQMLVTQLKNQDPLDPMSNDRFAVDLAQFSQLEQLMELNKKMGASSASSDISSLAAYLGHEVILNQDQVDVTNGIGSSISFNLDQAATNLMAELTDEKGSVVQTISLGKAEKGQHTVDLKGLNVPDGQYGLQLSAQDAQGVLTRIDASFGGVVSGFIPGDNPVLLVGGKEVDPADIKEVRMAPTAGSI